MLILRQLLGTSSLLIHIFLQGLIFQQGVTLNHVIQSLFALLMAHLQTLLVLVAGQSSFPRIVNGLFLLVLIFSRIRGDGLNLEGLVLV